MQKSRLGKEAVVSLHAKQTHLRDAIWPTCLRQSVRLRSDSLDNIAFTHSLPWFGMTAIDQNGTPLHKPAPSPHAHAGKEIPQHCVKPLPRSCDINAESQLLSRANSILAGIYSRRHAGGDGSLALACSTSPAVEAVSDNVTRA